VPEIAVRSAAAEDDEAIWCILEPVIRAGETYTLPRTLDRQSALAWWLMETHKVFVAEIAGQVAGTYFICANQQGGGSHVANCGYITSIASAGRGVARAMCAHSLEYAKTQGFLAMQFNFVVSTNDRAIRLWKSFGFETVGRLPKAFAHPLHGLIDALVMYRFL
jgi:ribosomal protein S18 acetylase RimI-like enzyme